MLETSSLDNVFPNLCPSTLDLFIISSAYLEGNPRVLPIHLTVTVDADLISSRSFCVTLKISDPLDGGGTYVRPTPNFLCRTSIERRSDNIFISLLHKSMFPSP